MLFRSLTRRRLMQAAAAGAAGASLVPGWLAAGQARAQPAPRIRYAAHQPEAAPMIALYRRAVAEMRRRDQHEPTSWLFQANMHWIPPEDAAPDALDRIFDPNRAPDEAGRQRIAKHRRMALDEANGWQNRLWATCPHSGSASVAQYFLPWHRLYLHSFERIVESIVGEPFALPYWDYGDPAHRALPAAFREEVDGSQTGNPLYHAERRKEMNTPGEPAELRPQDVDWTLAAREAAFMPTPLDQGFSLRMEDTPHGQVHVAVGTPAGMGSVAYAARDPIFWLHHANIDRLWESWRRAQGRADPGDAALPPQNFLFADPNGDLVEIASDAAMGDTDQLGYAYDRLEAVPAPVLVAGAAPFSAASTQILATTAAIAGPALTVAQGPASVDLALASPAAPAAFTALAPERRLLLILENVRVAENPATRFDVYLAPPPDAAPEERERYRVGSFNLFGVTGHPFGHAALHGMPTDAGGRRVFDVTDRLRQGLPPGLDTERLTVTVEPVDGPPTAPVTIGRVSVVAR